MTDLSLNCQRSSYIHNSNHVSEGFKLLLSVKSQWCFGVALKSLKLQCSYKLTVKAFLHKQVDFMVLWLRKTFSNSHTLNSAMTIRFFSKAF